MVHVKAKCNGQCIIYLGHQSIIHTVLEEISTTSVQYTNGDAFFIILIFVWVQSFDIGVEHILCLETVNYRYITRMSRFRFPMVSLEFFIDIILPGALWPWG